MKKMISIVGAGGKTSLVHELANARHREGASVLVTTATHMLIEEDTDLSGDFFTIRDQLAARRYCMAGIPCGTEPEKMQGLSETLIKELAPWCDYVIIEADGARHHSLKFPGASEPVILSMTTDVIVVMGIWEIGRPCREVVFRHELLEQEYDISPDRLVDEELIRLLEQVYADRLRQIGFSGRLHFRRRSAPAACGGACGGF